MPAGRGVSAGASGSAPRLQQRLQEALELAGALRLSERFRPVLRHGAKARSLFRSIQQPPDRRS
jgi:hypothetical protein